MFNPKCWRFFRSQDSCRVTKLVESNLRSKSKKKIKDTQNELLGMCNIQYGLPDAFLQEVRTAPELSTFLAKYRQLEDIEKFCKNKLNGVVLGIDSTYNICNYYVTICTYKNALLEVTGTDRSPVMIGHATTHA